MVDCCPQQPPMYHNGHTFTPQQTVAHQHFYHNQQQYHNNFSPTSSTSSSSSHGYPSPTDPDYQLRLNAYCGFSNDPLNRNNVYAFNNYLNGNNQAGRLYDQHNRVGYAAAAAAAAQQQHNLQMYHHATAVPLQNEYYHNHHVADSHVTSSSNPVRESRNKAEKNRRDKMLRSVHELGRIVPLVALASAANKRTDRTGILRLTASFIRIERQLKPGLLKLMQPTIQSFDWEKFLMEHLESILLVVSGSGKIVFVSNTVKDLLGHDPLDMLGRQLSDYAPISDGDELKKQLKINPDDNTTSSTPAEVAASDDSSDSSTNCSARQLQGQGGQNCNLDDQVLARSFLLRLSRGPKPPSKTAKNEKLDYQLVHINGHLRLSMRGDPTYIANRSLAKKNRTQQQDTTENDIFLVALVRPVKERIFALGEFNVREEYITRHHIDGRIIYTDHRISMVAGYLPGEVTGTPGFKYMHKDDVMWTMIALQQMFCGGKRIGNSCYKMLTKNGKFIFMRTHGYIELADDRETIQSFVCINTVITPQEFDKLNKEMKENFSPVMNQRRREISNSERGRKEAIPNVIDQNPLTPEVEDPVQLQKYIKNLLVEGIPSVPGTLDTPEDCREIENFMNVVTKNIPPVSYLNQQMNLNPPVVRVLKCNEKKAPLEATNDLTIKIQQQRPSVLRRIVSTREPTTSFEGCSVSKRMRTEVGAVPVQEARATVLMSPCQTPKRPLETELPPPPPPTAAPLSPLLSVGAHVGDYSVADSSDSLKLLFNAADYSCTFDGTETNLRELVAEPWLQTPTTIEYEALQIVEGLSKTQSHLELRLQKQSQELTEITENLEMMSDIDDNGISTIARLRGLTETTTQQLSEQEVTLRDLQRDTQIIFLEGHNYAGKAADDGDLQF